MGNAVQLKETDEASVPALTAVHEIAPTAAHDAAPLSFAQQQIWLHAQLVPQIPIYNEPVTIHRRGSLDVTVLERALTEIMRRHQAWRTTFSIANGEPVQVISPAAPVRVRVVDLSHLSASQKEVEAKKLGIEDALRPFDLSQGPLFRTLLLRFSETEHRLFLTLHHIIFDGYAIYRVLLPELAALYEAFSHGVASPLPELSSQYADFARWERESLWRERHLSSQLAYWRTQLTNLSVLQLPSDRPRPAIQSFRGATQAVSFSKPLSDGLKVLSRGEGATLFMGLIALFAVLLHRYSSSDDVAIGTVSSGRKRSELEGLLGYFLNPVVLRNDLSRDPTFRELLRRTREVTLDALSNDDAPFTQVVNEVHPDRSLSFSPLFQVLLTLEPPLPEAENGWSAALTQSEVDTGISKFDLCLELDERPSGLVGRFKYSTDLFEAATVARMAGHLTTLLEGVVSNPDQRISRLPILTEGESQQLCVEWNNTGAAYPADRCIHELISSQVERSPQAVAISDCGGSLTYLELHQASNRLAAYLQKRGIGPEKPVGLYLEPSRDMIVGMLAVLKAGGACVPLDPSYPAERVSHALTDTQVTLLLTQARLQSRLPHHNAEVLCIDSSLNRFENEEFIGSECQPANLAFVFHTSGSTGKPKGVEITQGNLVHSTCARSLYYGPAVERFLLLSSFAFDSSLAGIFGTLCQGGTLVLTPGPVQSNLTQLAGLVEQHQISHLLCVPSLYSLLLDQAKPGQLASLRVVIVAGESCHLELIARHHEILPGASLFNEYGPTEATVWSTVYKCSPAAFQRPVPIGRPIPNARVYVLDRHCNPLPVGVPGELHVGGPGVARGYLNHPAETSQRFIPDVFRQEAGGRLYKTGDLVRYLPDGNLELLGRLDHQVKIRGFRIELEEIEAVISDCKGVRQAAVALREAERGEPQLIAYVVPHNALQFDEEDLHRFVGSKLPPAMIPSSFVVLGNLPLMPNGKVDRQALPAPRRNVPGKQFVGPNNACESQLLEIWQAVLGKRGFGVADNFFDLGGHSLLAAKVLLRIEQRFERKLSLANVFQAPTIQQLAAMLGSQSDSVDDPALVPVQPHGSKPPLFWVRGGSFLLPLTRRLGLDQPVLGLHLPASDATQLPVPYKFEDIAGALVGRLRQIQPQGPYYLAGLCVNGVVAYEMARQLAAQGQKIALLALFDAQNPTYYEDFSEESRGRFLLRKAEYYLANFRRQKLLHYMRERLIGIRRHLRVRYWRIHRALGLRVNQRHLENLDTIVHPASFLYRPQPYPGGVMFFQSTDWPAGRYWDFYASWDGLLGNGMTVFKIPGGHESMFYEANVDLLAGHMERCLRDAMQSRTERFE